MDSARLKRSCKECARAKRRCSGGTPCQRCARQGNDCEYHRNPRDETINQPEPPKSASQAGVDTMPLVLDGIVDSELLNLPASLADGTTIDFAFGEVLDVAPLPTLSPTCQPRFSASTLKSFQTARLAYPIEVIKGAPALFVTENQTPWSHPLLWEDEMPKCLQEAHAACALHIAKNEINYHFVSRHIEHRVEELLELPLPTEVVDCLARTQALILYISTQIFGADYRSHAQAEQALPYLSNLALALHGSICNETVENPLHLSIFPLVDTRTFWRSWMLYQSAKRTVGIACFLITIACLLRGWKPPCGEHADLRSYAMLSSHLWQARSPFDFAVAWNEKEHLELRKLELQPILEKALPSDLDTFGRMVLVAAVGLDDVRGWCRLKGGQFEVTSF